jgi:hypothetical protein
MYMDHGEVVFIALKHACEIPVISALIVYTVDYDCKYVTHVA